MGCYLTGPTPTQPTRRYRMYAMLVIALAVLCIAEAVGWVVT